MTRTELFRSSAFRLMLVYLAIFGVSVLILGGFFYWATAATLSRQADTTINTEIAGLAEQYQRQGLAGLRDSIALRIERQKPTGPAIYLLDDYAYRRIIGNLNRWPQGDENSEGWIDFELTDANSGGQTVYPARARRFQLAGGFHLLVGRDVRELHHAQQRIIITLGWGLAITLLLGIGGGILMSRSTTRRIDTINQISREIMAGDLSRRIPTRATNDEFDQLADGLNRMLDRIQTAVENVRRVSDNIAHDLKTPLARLRNKLDEAQRNTDPVAQSAILSAATTEVDGLLSTFNALLRIARIETAESTAGFSVVDLQTLVGDIAEFYEPLSDTHGQQFIIRAEVQVLFRGDRDLLFQALANLLDNAVKYTPPGGTITLVLTTGDQGSEISVADTGPGVPAALHEKIFQRFFRADSSRSSQGNGLGLSLVAAVAHLHKIRVELHNTDPGLIVRLRLPATDPVARPTIRALPAA